MDIEALPTATLAASKEVATARVHKCHGDAHQMPIKSVAKRLPGTVEYNVVCMWYRWHYSASLSCSLHVHHISAHKTLHQE